MGFRKIPWWSTEGLEAWRILGVETPMSSSVRVNSFMKYGSCEGKQWSHTADRDIETSIHLNNYLHF